MTEDRDQCKEKCPEGQVWRDGKCILPEVTFTALVMSLSTSALYHLGEVADPNTGKTERNLMLAKHTIDTLNLLSDKTKGNLIEEEKGLLENLLYDLKLKYVKAAG